ncbi:unnamed protein product [Notodromas monacha]|uniref:Uncharacterized protein n=1 Tax=Notodromas monacha TaxID=399045 RepID=A0A7R9BPS4_9CRUS|nr:unnamed protein product [Notodromas monacha]CAG0919188.1 unnamed protein product [Notodromas monacha]
MVEIDALLMDEEIHQNVNRLLGFEQEAVKFYVDPFLLPVCWNADEGSGGKREETKRVTDTIMYRGLWLGLKMWAGNPCPVPCCLLATSPTSAAKRFRNVEDEHYADTLQRFPRPLGEPKTHIVAKFHRLSHRAISKFDKMEDTRYDDIFKSLAAECRRLTFQELLLVLDALNCWSPAASSRAKNFSRLWNAVDAALAKLVVSAGSPEGDLEEAVLMWHRLGLGRIAKSLHLIVDSLALKPGAWDANGLRLLLFGLLVARRWPSGLNQDGLEKILVQSMRQSPGSWGLLGLTCAAYFKTQTQCKGSAMFNGVIDGAVVALRSSAPCDSISLCSVAKFVGYMKRCLWQPDFEKVVGLLEAAVPRLDELSLLARVHLLETGAQHRVVVDAIFDHVQRDVIMMDGSRLKDLERFLIARDQVGKPLTPEEGSAILKHLECFQEEERHKHSLLASVRVLACHGFYSPVLLNVCLSEAFVDSLIDSQNFPHSLREFHELDSLVLAEQPHYKGPHLSDGLRDLAVMRYAPKQLLNSPEHQPVLAGETFLMTIASILGRIDVDGSLHFVSKKTLARKEELPLWTKSEEYADLWRKSVVILPASPIVYILCFFPRHFVKLTINSDFDDDKKYPPRIVHPGSEYING